MEAITGVFKTRTDAERAVKEAQAAGIPTDNITLLTPGTVDQVNQEMRSVPVDAAEQPGMGKAVGALSGWRRGTCRRHHPDGSRSGPRAGHSGRSAG